MQFASLILLSIFLAASGVPALVLDTPSTPVVSGEPLEITFQAKHGDPPFSIELVNKEIHDSFAIVNNVDPYQGSVDVVIPCVPAAE